MEVEYKAKLEGKRNVTMKKRKNLRKHMGEGRHAKPREGTT